LGPGSRPGRPRRVWHSMSSPRRRGPITTGYSYDAGCSYRHSSPSPPPVVMGPGSRPGQQRGVWHSMSSPRRRGPITTGYSCDASCSYRRSSPSPPPVVMGPGSRPGRQRGIPTVIARSQRRRRNPECSPSTGLLCVACHPAPLRADRVARNERSAYTVDGAARSGNAAASDAPSASIIPRSVIRPVTSRAGVTSKP
jgi:hypothetical protein